jgi:hypothetical protein
MNETTDYDKVLADLLEERANLDRMIAWVQGKLGKAETGTLSIPSSIVLPGAPQGAPMRFPRLRSDTFFKMSVQEAIRECLSIMRRPMSARDISNALQDGGLTHKAKNLYQTVFPTLMRMKEKGEVDKLASGDWGLSDWYTPGRRAEVENGKREPE